jgi:hypothetical protein
VGEGGGGLDGGGDGGGHVAAVGSSGQEGERDRMGWGGVCFGPCLSSVVGLGSLQVHK